MHNQVPICHQAKEGICKTEKDMRYEAEAAGREVRWKKIGTYRKTLKKVSFLHSKRYNMVVSSAYRLQHGRRQQIDLREEKELSIAQARVANGIDHQSDSTEY